MPILSKPSPITKGETHIFSIDKSALALHPSVVASEHFSSPNVWEKIIVKFKSETLGQFESVEFDANVTSPEGQFFVSSTAEDIFEVEKLTIVDKDGAILLIPRASLTAAEFDIDFTIVTPPLNYITWDLLTGYQSNSLTISATSGVSGGVSLSGNDVAVKSDADKATGDFDYTFKFDWSSATNIIDMFIGVTANNITTGTSFYVGLSCLYGGSNNPDVVYFWQQQSAVGNNQNLINGENIYRIQRVGLTINHYLNGSLVFSSVTGSLFTAYPTVRTMGNSVVNEAYITP